jgi:hypothetical protein
MSNVTVKCPFCERLFIMTRPLFLGERERTACPQCAAEAASNTRKMREEAAHKLDGEHPTRSTLKSQASQ